MLAVIAQAEGRETATWLEACECCSMVELGLQGQGDPAGVASRGRLGPLCCAHVEVGYLSERQWEPLRSTV